MTRHFCNVHQFIERKGTGIALSLLVEMFQYVVCNTTDTGRSCQRTLAVDVTHLFVLDILLFTHGADIIHAERQHVAIGNGIYDGIDMQLLAESLFGGFQVKFTAGSGIYRENRCSREAEKMIAFEFLDDGGVHISELAAVAFIEDEHEVLAIDLMRAVLADEYRQLLYITLLSLDAQKLVNSKLLLVCCFPCLWLRLLASAMCEARVVLL